MTEVNNSSLLTPARALRFISCLLVVMLVAACGAPRQPAHISYLTPADVPAPVIELAQEMPPYRLQVGDVLGIRLMLNPEFDEDVVIRPDGKISTVVARDVPARGQTPIELQKALNEHYKVHLTAPDIAVLVQQYAPMQIYVLGEVNAPGEHSFDRSPTLLQAIARAGGVRNSAKSDEILIMRRGADDQAQIYAADYQRATSGVDPQADVRLTAHDVVYVPQTGVARAYVQFEQYIQQFIRPAVGVGFSPASG